MSSSIPLSSIPTISDLYKKGGLSPARSPSTLPNSSSAFNSKISLIRADITKLATACIVNAANTSLLGGGGVDGAIHAAAGPGLYDECLPLNGCATGSAKMTSAHELPSKHVIHAVGPIYAKAKREGGEKRPKELLEGCYRTSLDLAASLAQAHRESEEEDGTGDEISIAFSCLSTGVYGYPSNEAARVACRVVRDWLQRNDSKDGKDQIARVVFCCFLEKDVIAYEEWLPKTFPPTTSDIPSGSDEEEVDEEETDEEEVVTASTGATQTLASTTLHPSKKQRTSSPSPAAPGAPTTNDDDKDWEPIEKPHRSLASSTVESASELDPAASTDSVPLGESTVNVDPADARLENVTAPGKEVLDGGLDDEGEGVKIEKPKGLEEEEGVEVERPVVENRLGKDW